MSGLCKRAENMDFDKLAERTIPMTSGEVKLTSATWVAATLAERERYAPLDIYEPNAEGKTQCIIRWMAETPSGWVGAWDKAALENVCITAAEAIEKGPT